MCEIKIKEIKYKKRRRERIFLRHTARHRQARRCIEKGTIHEVASRRQRIKQKTYDGVTANKEGGNELVANGDACYGLGASGRLCDWRMRGGSRRA